MRIEEDFLGKIEIPNDALYGINALRAASNFENTSRFNKNWFQAMGLVKQACYRTVIAFIEAARKKAPDISLPSGCDDVQVLQNLEITASEIASGAYFEHFIVPAIQGGAGTAINMNVNEIITNATLIKMGHRPGDYQYVDPFIHANIFQSTNDVVPTALRIALIKQLNLLEKSINDLRSIVEKQERENRDVLRTAYTQMQQAVPSSYGLLFSAWADALSRDWWRVSKGQERIKSSNLGGGAVGTAMAIPRFFVMEVTATLRELSGLPITRSENLTDATQNLDSFVEMHAILKAHAVNLEKIASDLRLLGSDIMQKPELTLPARLTGSSIMPGKVNPVISEFVISCSHKVYSNDMLISGLAAQGILDLNPYLPVLGDALLESIHLLTKADESLLNGLFAELKINSATALHNLINNPVISTALIPLIGYRKATELASLMKTDKIDIYEANRNLNCIESNKLEIILKPENLLKTGYSLFETN